MKPKICRSNIRKYCYFIFNFIYKIITKCEKIALKSKPILLHIVKLENWLDL